MGKYRVARNVLVEIFGQGQLATAVKFQKSHHANRDEDPLADKDMDSHYSLRVLVLLVAA